MVAQIVKFVLTILNCSGAVRIIGQQMIAAIHHGTLGVLSIDRLKLTSPMSVRGGKTA